MAFFTSNIQIVFDQVCQEQEQEKDWSLALHPDIKQAAMVIEWKEGELEFYVGSKWTWYLH